MDTTTLVIAVVGLALSIASLTWQLTTFALSGHRVKVDLRIGARNATGLVSMEMNKGAGQLSKLAVDGFTMPVIVVRARNVGRLPVDVTGVAVASDRGFSWTEPPNTTDLPYRLDAGASHDWLITLAGTVNAWRAWSETMNQPLSKIAGRLELATGKQVHSGWHPLPR